MTGDSFRHVPQAFPREMVAHLDEWAARHFAEHPDTACASLDGLRTELAQLIFDALVRSPVVAALAATLGSVVCFPLRSCLFRRVTGERQAPVAFEQDAAFMGDGYLSIKCWVPLQDGSPELPGLELLDPSAGRWLPSRGGTVPDRSAFVALYADVLPTAAAFHSPVYRAGDALLFDHYTVHRMQPTRPGAHTSLELRAVSLRDAIERFGDTAIVVAMAGEPAFTHRRVVLFHTGADSKTNRPWAERLGGMVPEAMHPHEQWREIMGLRDQVATLYARAAKAEQVLADWELPLWRRWWRRLYAAMQP